MRRECLDVAIYLKTQDSLRSAEVFPLQHSAILQFQRVGEAESGENQCNASHHHKSGKIPHLHFPSPPG
ncbi:MAG: hypothetical protein DMG52_22530 [Acidobacteria bacterium]|nr:MAG: hypothetical protein DMG52_22530 [Acidobacteriota bacterium]